MKVFVQNRTLQLIALAIVMIILFSLRGTAQGLEITTTVQKNVMGLQSGYGLTYRWINGLGAGLFYQSNQPVPFERSANTYPFTGAEISVPLKRCSEMELLMNLKGGLVNQKFLIVTPEIETRIRLSQRIKLSFGLGIRSRQPAVSGKLILTTLNNLK